MLTMSNHLICFLGRNGSGKTYQSSQLVKKGYTKISLADPVRELAWKSLGWRPITNDYYNTFKESFISNYKDSHLGNYGTNNLEVLQFETTGRQYLQNLAEGCKEMFGDDFWAKAWEEKVKENLGKPLSKWDESNREIYLVGYPDATNKIVTDDIRFPVEIEAAHKLGAKFVWCDYKQGDYEPSEHISEALANKILASGKFKDGEEISYEQLQTFMS